MSRCEYIQEFRRSSRDEILAMKCERDDARREFMASWAQNEVLESTNERLKRELREVKTLLREAENMRTRVSCSVVRKHDSLDGHWWNLINFMSKADGIGASEDVPKIQDDPASESLEAEKHISEIRGQPLPHELMLEIAHRVRASYSYASLGKLGLASKALHEDITPIFHETMVCDLGYRMDWEMKNGRLVRKPLNELPLHKWKHTKYLIVDETASLLKCHDSYFPNLMVGISKFWRNGAVAEIIIDAKVSMDVLLEHLKIPLMWDEEGDQTTWTIRSIERINRIFVGQNGGISSNSDTMPCLPVPPICIPRGTSIRFMEIDFERGAIDNDFASTIQALFELMDPEFDPMLDTLTPQVCITISDGLEGFEAFVPLLEPIMRKHPALSIELEVQELAVPYEAESEDTASPVSPIDNEFVALMRLIKDTYASLWNDIRPYRRLEGTAQAPAFLFNVKVQFVWPESGRAYRELRGEVEDLEEEPGEDSETELNVRATSLDLETRESRLLWDQRAEEFSPTP